MLPVSLDDRPTPAPLPPSPHQTIATPSNAPAQPTSNDRPASAPLPLSMREQKVCDYLSQGSTFEAIAKSIGCSIAAAKEYSRHALAKRQRTTAPVPLEQGDRKTTAKLEPPKAEQAHRRLASASAALCERSPFHSPAVEAPARRERPNPMDLCVPSLFVTGESVMTERKLCTKSPQFTQTTATDRPPRHPRRRKRTSRRNRRWGVGFRVAAAS